MDWHSQRAFVIKRDDVYLAQSALWTTSLPYAWIFSNEYQAEYVRSLISKAEFPKYAKVVVVELEYKEKQG